MMSDHRAFAEGPLVDPDERQTIFATLDSFRQYRRNVHHNVTHRRRQNLYALPKHHWQVLAAPPFHLLDTLNAIDDALDCNADIADAILELGLHVFGLPSKPEKTSPDNWHGTAKPGDLAKAHSTIRQFYRDWSAEGFAAEVEPILSMIVNDLKALSILPVYGAEAPSLLMPGAGLGRMLFSMSLRGYNVEGNEISYHQLIASNFVLNATKAAEQYKLYPFASTFTNHKTRANQLRSVHVPDIHPATAMAECQDNTRSGEYSVGSMNMTAGDFLTSYGDPASQHTFDAIVSVYFIDTAPNIIRYIETVRNCLKTGGVWINIGPLLWHHDDRKIGDLETNHQDRSASTEVKPSSELAPEIDTGIAEPGSFELTDEEIMLLLRSMRFEILKHEYIPSVYGGYIQDPGSMIQNQYECSHWVARKLS